MAKKWFEEWFNTRYYHILYKKRNTSEAADFLALLVERLGIVPSLSINALDLCCGKGRHSVVLRQLGFNTTGLDLSPNNIAEASKTAVDGLCFAVHDMRLKLEKHRFDVVFNLFTSFGYFEDDTDNQRVVDAIAHTLKPGGVCVLDYMNATKAVNSFSPYYEKTVDGIDFKISKKIEKGFIKKSIQFATKDAIETYEEAVKIILLEDFIQYFTKAGMMLQRHFGSYALEPFDPEHSDRLILIFTKNA